MTHLEFDLYGELGVSPRATPDQIKQAHRQLVRIWHPDINHDPAAEERFKRISEAHEILGDPKKRALYDMGLRGLDPYQSVPPPRFVLTLIQFVQLHPVATLMICCFVLVLFLGLLAGVYLLLKVIPDWVEAVAVLVVWWRWKAR